MIFICQLHFNTVRKKFQRQEALGFCYPVLLYLTFPSLLLDTFFMCNASQSYCVMSLISLPCLFSDFSYHLLIYISTLQPLGLHFYLLESPVKSPQSNTSTKKSKIHPTQISDLLIFPISYFCLWHHLSAFRQESQH